MTKILALYLPQFHAIPENNRWWGEGFTEWEVVKAAKKINKHTLQPRIPEGGYYDLSKCESIKYQAKLARNHGVDGFIIYSYYSNGEKLLNTPSELLLENLDIDIEYCFSWANHDWMRTWFSYNREMLRKQQYARNDKEIENHFNYYLPFFKDERYIKINNRPVLVIYDYDAIPNIDDYIRVWNQKAKSAGFNGIYLIQTLGGRQLIWNKKLFDACFDFEPTYTTFSQMHIRHSINRFKRGIKKILNGKWMTNYFDYNKVCRIIKKREVEAQGHFLGVFAEWDNTPRHADNGTIFTNFSISAFKDLFYCQLKKSIDNNNALLIIDAWNEWGEGAFMEPDNYYHMEKLEVIKECKDRLLDNKGV